MSGAERMVGTRAETLRETLDLLGVEVRHKSTSRLMRFLTWLFGVFNRDFGRAWTTIGPRVIYAPDGTDLARLDRHEVTILHELVHIGQARRWPVWFQLSYLLVPVPIVFAWFRWRWEREAYLVTLRARRGTIEQVVQVLWRGYGWCWPRPWMRRWFERELS